MLTSTEILDHRSTAPESVPSVLIMPSFNVTVTDSSPLIQYGGSWVDTPKTDSNWEQYQNQTYHITNQDGATATLQFNGSAIYIFGARRQGYAGYSVTLDGENTFQVDAPTSSTTEYNVLLYNATSLDTTKEHQITLRNAQSSSGSSLDVDHLIITAGDGNAQTLSDDVFWMENNTNIAYSAGWTSASLTSYSDGTAELTYNTGASATITFTGNAIGLYGATNLDHGMFSVSMDGGPQTNYNGYSPEVHFNTLLYYASGLPHGRHVLKLTNISPSSTDPNHQTNGLELDGVAISSWADAPVNSPSHPGSDAPTQPTSGAASPDATNSATPPVKHTSTGIITGVAVAAAAGVVLLAVGLFLYFRRRRRRRQAEGRQNVLLQEEFRPDPFKTPSRGSLRMHQDNSSSFMNENVMFFSPAPSSITPSHTFAQPMTAYASSGASSEVLAHPAILASTSTIPTHAATTGTGMSEKRQLVLLHAASVSATSSGVASHSAADDETNPHRDFPPPDYGQIFSSPRVY